MQEMKSDTKRIDTQMIIAVRTGVERGSLGRQPGEGANVVAAWCDRGIDHTTNRIPPS